MTRRWPVVTGFHCNVSGKLYGRIETVLLSFKDKIQLHASARSDRLIFYEKEMDVS